MGTSNSKRGNGGDDGGPFVPGSGMHFEGLPEGEPDPVVDRDGVDDPDADLDAGAIRAFFESQPELMEELLEVSREMWLAFRAEHGREPTEEELFALAGLDDPGVIDDDSFWEGLEDAEDDVTDAAAASQVCAWCSAPISEDGPAYGFGIRLAEGLRGQPPEETEVGDLPLSHLGRSLRVLVLGVDAPGRVKDGFDLFVGVCSETCAKAALAALGRERNQGLN